MPGVRLWASRANSFRLGSNHLFVLDLPDPALFLRR